MPPGGGVPAQAYPAYVSGEYIQLLTGEDPADYVAVDANLLAKPANPYNMHDILMSAFAAGNPYDAAYSFDPTELLSSTQTQLDAAIAAVEALDPVANWESYIDAAVAKLPDFLPTGSSISAEVTAFRTSLEPDYEQALNAFAGGMVEINAVGGSAFAFGVIKARTRFEAEIARHRSQLESTMQREKVLFLVQAAGEMSKELLTQVGSLQSLAQLQGEVNRVSIVAQKEWLEQELANEIERIFWDPSLFKFGGQMLASITGVATPDRGMSRTSSAIAGAITAGSQFAALGAQAGMGPAVLLGVAGLFLGGYGGYATA